MTDLALLVASGLRRFGTAANEHYHSVTEQLTTFFGTDKPLSDSSEPITFSATGLDSNVEPPIQFPKRGDEAVDSLVDFEKRFLRGTDREIRASFERLARATLEVCSARVLPGDGRKTVWFLVSIPKNALLTAISFIVSIVSGAAVAE